EAAAKFSPVDENRGGKGPGAKLGTNDPLAVLAHGKGGGPPAPAPAPEPATEIEGPAGTVPLPAPLQGTIVAVTAALDQPVSAGQPLVIMES
ncbi:hypothetical protein ABTH13_20000, partial [Acinetobacter baumannii]